MTHALIDESKSQWRTSMQQVRSIDTDKFDNVKF